MCLKQILESISELSVPERVVTGTADIEQSLTRPPLNREHKAQEDAYY